MDTYVLVKMCMGMMLDSKKANMCAQLHMWEIARDYQKYNYNFDTLRGKITMTFRVQCDQFVNGAA